MMSKAKTSMRCPGRVFGLAMFLLCALGLSIEARAHCDTLGGPVVADARAALEQKDVTPALKWVRTQDEAQIRETFRKTLAVREQSAEARELADMYFFETLVRIHRAGEGVAYTGLKPAGEIEHGLAMADQSIESGSADSLARTIGSEISNGIKARFERVVETGKHAGDNVPAGREFVEAYVDYVHFVENIYELLQSKAHFDHSNEIHIIE